MSSEVSNEAIEPVGLSGTSVNLIDLTIRVGKRVLLEGANVHF